MKVSRTINLRTPDLKLVTLHPGDTVPDWAEELITNPNVILVETDAEAEAPREEAEQAPVEEPAQDYSKVPKADLVAMLEQRGLPVDGKVGELRARLTEADSTVKHSEDVDPFELPREQLEALANQRGIEFEADLSNEELATLIDNTGE